VLQALVYSTVVNAFTITLNLKPFRLRQYLLFATQGEYLFLIPMFSGYYPRQSLVKVQGVRDLLCV